MTSLWNNNIKLNLDVNHQIKSTVNYFNFLVLSIHDRGMAFYKLLKNFGNMLEVCLMPYKPFLDRNGITIKSYEEVNRELGYIVIGVKLIFTNPEIIDKLTKGE